MNILSSNFLRLVCILFLAAAFISCKNENLIQRGDSIDVAYKKAMGLYQSGDYSDAAKAFETVIQIGRGTEYGREAQYYLAESYFNDERYMLAASEYSRYVTLHPRSDKREDAQFKEAISYYKLSPRYKLDQKHTRTAIEKFRLYNSRYPNSDRVDEAAKYITELRSKLAKKLYYAADLYLRTDRYEAAIVYYDLTIDDYPESIWAQRALVDKIDTYVTYADRSVASKQRERYQSAVEAYETFIQLFPDGKYRSEAEDHVDEARAALANLEENPEGAQQEDSLDVDDTSTGSSR
ncbi:outer membrane protein assembly factor BamD [Aliifodinibius salicampi]|uniref:Outer membrane protein assembly factor BamD n=1 Tax=Fodinibius salicampi TaxID=1920655 RepID=A0ABT3PVQ4_9BACT|nr:outer membrane protein assembly factor BamD [Fodinibius salicampi]MCW9711913.1 outer membrane protein assembly factor BamD [Fodinibius salicampi]